jgi:tRNA (guanosine-2'-O-)-methyltransferase
MTTEHWSELLRPERIERLRGVVSRRTSQVTMLLEAVDKGHNQSAILRTCEAFGHVDVHIVRNAEGQPFSPSKGITQGSDKWLRLHQHDSISDAIGELKSQGFQVFASRLDERARPLPELDLTGKVALVMGNERDGISDEVAELCDATYMIPMLGFVQSFNVSVAAALSMYEVYRQRLDKYGANGDLTEEEQEGLFEHFVERSLENRVLRQLQKESETPTTES